MTAALLTRLIAAGTPADLVAEVAMELAEARAAVTAIEQRRQSDRSRKQRERNNSASRDVTGGHANSADSAEVTDGLPPDKETSPRPPKEINPPTPTDVANAPSVPPAGAAAGVVDPGRGTKARSTRQRKPGSRLPVDWQPPPIIDLPLETQAVVKPWPTGAYQLVGVQFRNHWRAEGRAIGAKRDWQATWCNWLFKEVAEVRRKQRAGFDFADAARSLRNGGDGGGVSAQRLAETAANFRKWGRDDQADEYDRLAAAARERERADTS